MRINFMQGDVMRIGLADQSVHAIICSPPYWSLRVYLTGDLKHMELGAEKLHDCNGWATGDSCGECFVCHVRQYAAEFWRVLRTDGTWWLNLGDGYSGSGKGIGSDHGKAVYDDSNIAKTDWSKICLPAKNLVGIPWRCALALQADGWTLRSAPPWIKSNPMPESTKDRPNTAHEYWFMLTKGKHVYSDMEMVKQESTGQTGRAAGFIRENAGPDVPGQQAKQHRKDRKEHVPGRYYSDMEAVRKEYTEPLNRWGGDKKKTTDNLKGEDNPYQLAHRERDMRPNKAGRHWRTNDFINTALDYRIYYLRKYLQHLEDIKENKGMMFDEDGNPEALFFNTKGYKGAHFATFNGDMIEPLIKFSTSEYGVCPTCGAPWNRVIEKTEPSHYTPKEAQRRIDATGGAITGGTARCTLGVTNEIESKTVEWKILSGNKIDHDGKTNTLYETGTAANRLALLRQAACERGEEYVNRTVTVGFRPSCNCYNDAYRTDFPKSRSARKRYQREASGDWFKRVRKQPGLLHWEVKPAIVFDGFSGSGTTCMVANQLGRIGVGLELSMDYIKLARERTGLQALQAWEGGKQAAESDLSGLPMFGEME